MNGRLEANFMRQAESFPISLKGMPFFCLDVEQALMALLTFEDR